MKIRTGISLMAMLAAPSFSDTWTTSTSGQITTQTTTTKVGVGITTTPSEKLQVGGGSILIDNNQYLKTKNSSGSGINAVGLTSGNQLNIGSTNSSTSLQTGPSGASRLFINSTGNVGIGTTSPAVGRMLDVNGTAKATAFEGDGNLVTNVAPIGSKSVLQYGAAPTNADNTSNFQNALNAVFAAGGGIVFVPAGKYTLLGTLNIPCGVTLQGTWASAHDANLDSGTTLNASSTATFFITMQQSTGLKGITIFYPGQNNLPAKIIRPRFKLFRGRSSGMGRIPSKT